MREILFRGKRKDNGEWVCGMPWIFKDHACVCPWREGMCKYDTGFYPVHVIPETVGQFTGQTDKNGKKIFEGDILQHDDRKYLVYYYPTFAMYMLTKLPNGGGRNGMTTALFECEVIGNIHDNPELLEG